MVWSQPPYYGQPQQPGGLLPHLQGVLLRNLNVTPTSACSASAYHRNAAATHCGRADCQSRRASHLNSEGQRQCIADVMSTCDYAVAGRPAGYAGSPRPGVYGTPQQLQRPQGYNPQQVMTTPATLMQEREGDASSTLLAD